jgi:maleylpyruvate isomerase
VQDVLDQLDHATAGVVAALGDTDLDAPSLLPGWSRLTIACHLRYGAEALRWMTHDALAGRPTSYYPDGRATQRPVTLVPRQDESSADVVTSLRQESEALHEDWRTVKEWAIPVVEPPDNPDLGPVELRRLALARLTEVEVQSTDLGLGLGPWSETFVRQVLPMRLEWLTTRRSNHRDVDTTIHASWLLVATDMTVSQVVTVDGPTVASRSGDTADTTIMGTGAELLALLLGRAPAGFAPDDFSRALPGP